jgi:hypothetical protein
LHSFSRADAASEHPKCSNKFWSLYARPTPDFLSPRSTGTTRSWKGKPVALLENLRSEDTNTAAVMVRRSRNLTVAELGCRQLQLPGEDLPRRRRGQDASDQTAGPRLGHDQVLSPPAPLRSDQSRPCIERERNDLDGSSLPAFMAPRAEDGDAR